MRPRERGTAGVGKACGVAYRGELRVKKGARRCAADKYPVICCRTTGLLFFSRRNFIQQSKNNCVLVFDVRLVPLAQLPAYVLNETSRAPHLTRAAWTAFRLSAVLMAVEQRRLVSFALLCSNARTEAETGQPTRKRVS